MTATGHSSRAWDPTRAASASVSSDSPRGKETKAAVPAFARGAFHIARIRLPPVFSMATKRGKADAIEMKRLIEQYQSDYLSRAR